MKKWWLSFIAAVFILSIGAATAAAKNSADFSDLADLDAATKAKFDALINAGIFEGVSDNSFGLNEEMTRAQFAKVASLIMRLNVNTDLQTSSFSDVSMDDAANGWALPYIEAAKKAGLLDGVGGGEFNPSGQMTKEQLAAVLVRMTGVKTNPSSDFQDSTVSDWAKGYVSEALRLKLLPKSEDGTFGGTTQATRDLLVIGSYETKVQIDPGPKVSGVTLDAGTDLKLDFDEAIDPKSVKLENIKVNGVTLDPNLDSFTVSEDGKSLLIKLRSGFPAGNNPTVTMTGIQSTFGGTMAENEPLPEVKVTNPPPPVNNTPVISVPATVATPTASPASGEVESGTTVTLSTATDGATIYYTTDGTTPSSDNGTAYSSPITIDTAVTIKAVAVKDGMTDSEVLSASYTISAPVLEQVATPTASPASGELLSGSPVTLTTTTDGATIYYTTDGTTPSSDNGTAYSSPIAIDTAVTIKAVAVKNGMTDSEVLSASYTISVPVLEQVATPTASPASGELLSGSPVTLTTTTDGATIYYTTDGTTPSSDNGTAYSSPIAIDTAVTIKAVAVKNGMTDSEVLSASYTISAPVLEQVATPMASPASGELVSGSPVTLTTTTDGATIYYTTDGTTPSSDNGTAYSSPIAIDTAVTIKAVAVKNGMTDSEVLSASYTISAPVLEQVATPTADPASGELLSGSPVTLTTTTDGATIYYTTDGTTPSSDNGTAYSSPIAIDTAVTIKAVAVKNGMTDSEVLSASYTISAPVLEQVATPTADPASGELLSGSPVTLTTTTDGATIYYTTDGTTPSSDNGAAYSSPIAIDTAVTIKAVAVKDGMTDSEVLSASYTISAPVLEQVATPSANFAGGAYLIGTQVELSTTTTDATIYYTTNGTTPSSDNGTVYHSPISIAGPLTIKAVAVMTGMTDSEVFIANYTLLPVGPPTGPFPPGDLIP